MMRTSIDDDDDVSWNHAPPPPRHDPSTTLASSMRTHLPLMAATAAAAGMLWMTFPLVALSTKCFLTAQQCTRFGGWQGANFAHPLTAAALHLFLVGLSLLVLSAITSSSVFCSCHPECCAPLNDDDDDDGRPRRDNSHHPTLHVKDKLVVCAPVGVVFGIKYSVGHWALQVTPVLMYELFHALNLLFVALFAHVVLGEGLQTYGEILGCLGVMVGSIVAAQHGFDHHHEDHESSVASSSSSSSDLVIALVLNILNAMLAGILVVLLRWSMLQCHGRVLQVTAIKMLMGGAALLIPLFFFHDDTNSDNTGIIISTMDSKQWLWLGISSVAILLYHVSLSLLCWLAAAPTVAIVEALRPVPAFVAIALLQKMEPKKANFWIGSAIVLASAVCFHLSRRFCRDEKERRNAVPKTARKDQRSLSTSTESTHLLVSDITEEEPVLRVGVENDVPSA
jgi:hypothetical protein